MRAYPCVSVSSVVKLRILCTTNAAFLIHLARFCECRAQTASADIYTEPNTVFDSLYAISVQSRCSRCLCGAIAVDFGCGCAALRALRLCGKSSAAGTLHSTTNSDLSRPVQE